LTNPRLIAHKLLMRVIESDSYINLLLPSLLRKEQVSDVDRGLVQELSYGALRWQLQYDRLIEEITGGKQLSPKVRVALRLGLHQLFRMRVPAHAAINESVELVKIIEPKAAGLANAVLRQAQRKGLDQLLLEVTDRLENHEKLALVHSHPIWIVHALKSALELDGRAQQLEELLAANNATPVVNLAALSPAAESRLKGEGLTPGEASPIGYLLNGNPERYLASDVRVQDQGSQLVALTLMELAGASADVLDMCSGPGGKSAVLQSRIDSGTLTCMEPNATRAKLVSDALGPGSKAQILIAPGQQAKRQSYDAVLLDAPCSGLGSLRRKPESRWRKTAEQLGGLQRTQAELLDAAIDSLRPGGVVLYSTCSPVTTETNAQISAALERHNDVELIDVGEVLVKINPDLEVNRKRKTVQLWTQVHGTDSMFMAALRKKLG
jgi:16S rRNA (cytosine967-C5)-methyltransferase